MRAQWLAVMVCLGGWASTPAMGLVTSIHLLDHQTPTSGQSADLILLVTHGHHHEFDVPDHTHEMILESDAASPESAMQQIDLDHPWAEEFKASSPIRGPVGLPPPQLHTLRALLL